MHTQLNQANKKIIWDFWQALEKSPADKLLQTLRATMREDILWCGPDPINTLQGVDAFATGFWRPLMQSFPDLRRETFIFMGGQSNGREDSDLSLDSRMWVSGTGMLQGTFADDYLGIPATGKAVEIRWGEFCCLQDGKITTVFCLVDYIDLMQQAGIQVLPPSLGQDGLYLAPKANDGILQAPQNDDISAYSLDHIRRFIFNGLNRYDENDLGSMGIANYFEPDIQWYGPGGIGACLSLKEFEDYHQKPWLQAYPDRLCGNIDSLYAEHTYTAAAGWGDVKARHTGEYKGVAATNKPLEFNGLDWWKREGEKFIENWVFVDMVHLFRQFDVDLFARMQQQIK